MTTPNFADPKFLTDHIQDTRYQPNVFDPEGGFQHFRTTVASTTQRPSLSSTDSSFHAMAARHFESRYLVGCLRFDYLERDRAGGYVGFVGR